MNRLLASTLEILNIVLAAGIVVVSMAFFTGFCTALGYSSSTSLIIATIIGVVIAGVVCGSIAMIALIENHLRVIAEGQQMGSMPIARRREPNVSIDD